jgi:hypothetical protein
MFFSRGVKKEKKEEERRKSSHYAPSQSQII